MELVISYSFLNYITSVLPDLCKSDPRDLLSRSGEHAPYVIQNRTGYPIFLWADSSGDGSDTVIFKLADGENKPWVFSDWLDIKKVHYNV